MNGIDEFENKHEEVSSSMCLSQCCSFCFEREVQMHFLPHMCEQEVKICMSETWDQVQDFEDAMERYGKNPSAGRPYNPEFRKCPSCNLIRTPVSLKIISTYV